MDAGEIRFGRFRLDLKGRQVWRDSHPVRLDGRALDLLCAIASANGNVISKDEIIAQLWPGRAVGEGNLHVQISTLRRALAENGDGHSYVVTVPGRGYRLAGLGGSELTGLEQPARQAPASSEDLAALSDQTVAEPGSDASHPEDVQIPERRQLTLISGELVGVERLATLLDPEDLAAALSGLHCRCSEIVASFGGNVTRFAGGTMLGCFGYPQAGEHDAEQAVRAGLALVDGVRDRAIAGRPIQLRIGIATGPVVVANFVEERRREGGLIGGTVVLAAALRRTAEPETVVIADSTRRLVGGLFDLRRRGELAPDGIDEPVAVYTVLGAGAGASRFEAMHGPLLTPLVGREEEIELLLRRWQRAKSGELRGVLITGEPGIGKSRLCAELRDRIRHEPHAFIRYCCSPHHQDSTLHPVVRQLEAASGFERSDGANARLAKLKAFLVRESAASEADVALLADMLSLGGSRNAAETGFSPRRRRELTFEALVRHLATLATRQPVLVVFEDAQWSDPTTLELLDLALRRLAALRVLVLITFRPEFVPPWTGQSHVTMLTLSRLDRRDGAALVRRVVGNDALANGVVEAIVERTDGVPLFVEELSKALVESDAPVGAASGAQWSIVIPTTLQASLMARLDRLPQGKHVARIGAVIGRVFPHALLAEVCNVPEAQLGQGLRELVVAGLMNVHGVPPEATYTFKHVLVRDTAYESLLRRTRQQLHAKIADALETHSPELLDSQPEIFAQHYTEAGLLEKSVAFWAKAGDRSIARSAMGEAAAQFQKGLDQVAALPDRPERQRQELEFCSALGAALMAVKGFAAPETGHVYARARGLWEQLGFPSEFLQIPYAQSVYHRFRGELELAQRLDEELLHLSTRRDDPRGLILGHLSAGHNLMAFGRFGSSRSHLEKLLTLYDPVAHGSLVNEVGCNPHVTAQVILAKVLYCLGFPDQGLARSKAAIAEARKLGHPPSQVMSLANNTMLCSLTGYDGALEDQSERVVALAQEHGFPYWGALGTILCGWAKVRRNDLAQGVSLLHRGLMAYRATGAKLWSPYHHLLLAGACDIAGRTDEALILLDNAIQMIHVTRERIFAAELHRHKGQLLLCGGHTEEAEALYCKALSIAEEQGAKLWELRAAVNLARLRLDQGRRTEARELLAPVYGWFTEGFDTPDLKEAKALLDDLSV